jgi:hypothetical protein
MKEKVLEGCFGLFFKPDLSTQRKHPKFNNLNDIVSKSIRYTITQHNQAQHFFVICKPQAL